MIVSVSTGSNFKVVVRVRPNNEREQKLGAESCVQFDGRNSIVITKVPMPETDKSFS